MDLYKISLTSYLSIVNRLIVLVIRIGIWLSGNAGLLLAPILGMDYPMEEASYTMARKEEQLVEKRMVEEWAWNKVED